MNSNKTLEERFEAIMNYVSNTSLAKHKSQPTKIRNDKSTRKLLKLKHELDSLDLKTKQTGVAIQQFGAELRQFGVDLRSMREMEEKVEQPIVSLEEIHIQEHNEVNFDLPPNFDEHEEQEEEMEESIVKEQQEDDDDQRACESSIILGSPQRFELNQEEVTHGLEQYLTPKECPHHQQELRTILFQQREYDVYSLGHPTQPCEKNFFKVTSCQNPSMVDLSSSPLFEFHDKRHIMEFFLNFKVPFLMGHMRRKGGWDQGILFSKQYNSKCVFMILVA